MEAYRHNVEMIRQFHVRPHFLQRHDLLCASVQKIPIFFAQNLNWTFKRTGQTLGHFSERRRNDNLKVLLRMAVRR
jgi:hypothetical protein